LRPGDVGPSTPTLQKWADSGAAAPLTPTFPCVTSPVQASILAGTPPDRHGVIANGFYYRDRSQVEFWVAQNSVIAGDQIWDALRRQRPGLTAAAWHLQNIKGAAADYIVTPAPVHKEDGTTKLWCYSKPEGLYQQLLDELGHFPIQHYWGPMAGIESTQWILRAAQWLIERHRPNFHYVYLPHLDYAAQKFGPNSPQAAAALVDLDRELAAFDAYLRGSAIGDDVVILAVSEYAMTGVTGALYPNRLLREAGLLALAIEGGAEYLDLAGSAAMAMVDHQVAHVYCQDAKAAARAADVLRGVEGIASLHGGQERGRIGLNHERAGDIVLVAHPDHWFAYYWWLDDAAAPPFARTVDIHRKPGYDPVELFFDPATRSIPLDASLVKGSHGAPAVTDEQQAVLICSQAGDTVTSERSYRDTDVKRLVLELFGVR
ncbi:MAG: alkaline phosphatase family protein, partial [Planctomycetota bacterium]